MATQTTTVQDVHKQFQIRKIKVHGEIKEVQQLRDGNMLMRDDVNFFKVCRNTIKLGRFTGGRFHYSLRNVLLVI